MTSGGKSPVDFLQGAIAEVQSPGDLARTILALEGAGVEPREFGGRNLVAALLAKRRKDGSYEGWPNSTAYAVLALRSAGVANVADSVDWLREVQNEDGGWGDTAGSPSNADGTGAVLQALDAVLEGGEARGRLPAPGPAAGRRLAARRQRRAEHAVDRLGGRGAARRGRRTRPSSSAAASRPTNTSKTTRTPTATTATRRRATRRRSG